MQHETRTYCLCGISLAAALIAPLNAATSQTFLAGNVDSLAAPVDVVTPSAQLVTLLAAAGGTRSYDFAAGINGGYSDSQCATTFGGLPPAIVAATLEIAMVGGNCCGPDSDGVLLSFVTPSTTSYASSIAWARSFGPLSGPSVFPTPDPTGLLGGWGGGTSATLVLNLASLPLLGGGTLDLLPLINANGFIDVNIADDTAVDYVRLVVHQCGATIYCTAKTSSSGCVPSIQSTGSPSLSAASAFQITTTSVEAAKSGVTFFSLTGPNAAPFQGGFLCAAAPLYRLVLKNSGGAGACQGALAYSLQDLLNQPAGGALFAPGTGVNCQTWFRDPASPSTTGLSNALEIWLCP
jgi:hypothetical protein